MKMQHYKPDIYLDSYCEPYNSETGPSGVEVEYWLTPTGPDAFVAYTIEQIKGGDNPELPTKREQLRVKGNISLVQEFLVALSNSSIGYDVFVDGGNKPLCNLCQKERVNKAGEACKECTEMVTAIYHQVTEENAREVQKDRQIKQAHFMLALAVPLLAVAWGVWIFIKR